MLAIRSAHLFDGERFASGPVTVIVDGATIAGVESGWPDLPAEIDVLDVGEATVLPGLVDTHVHLVGDSGLGALDRVAGYTAEEMARVVGESLRRQLACGVTTVRDLGDRDWVTVEHRDRQRAARAMGRPMSREPTVLASGPPITSPGGHCHYMGGAVGGLDGLARVVQERADRRVDIVKVMASGGMNTPGTDVLRTQFTDEEMTFLTGEAHRHGLVVTAHAHGLPAVEQALAAGVDGLEHGSCLTENGVQVTDEVLAALVERQIPVGGALAAPPAAALARAPAALRARIERAGLTPGDVQADPAADSPRSASGGSAVRCRPGLGDLTLPCPRLPA
jgi:imidazolonepropionase-like amidohydrolase